jgi:hypothetical protein
MRRMKSSTRAWCSVTALAACAGSLLTAAILYGRRWKTWRKSTAIPSTGPSGNGLMTEEVYFPAFPDGSPVTIGRFQEWLDMIRADPGVSEEEYQVAEAMINHVRRRLN